MIPSFMRNTTTSRLRSREATKPSPNTVGRHSMGGQQTATRRRPTESRYSTVRERDRTRVAAAAVDNRKFSSLPRNRRSAARAPVANLFDASPTQKPGEEQTSPRATMSPRRRPTPQQNDQQEEQEQTSRARSRSVASELVSLRRELQETKRKLTDSERKVTAMQRQSKLSRDKNTSQLSPRSPRKQRPTRSRDKNNNNNNNNNKDDESVDSGQEKLDRLREELEEVKIEVEEERRRCQFVKQHSASHVERQSQLLEMQRHLSHQSNDDTAEQLANHVQLLEADLEEANLRNEFVKIGSAAHTAKQRELARIHSDMATQLSQQEQQQNSTPNNTTNKTEELERLSRENSELKKQLQEALESVDDIKRKADFQRSHSGAHIERQAQLLSIQRQLSSTSKEESANNNDETIKRLQERVGDLEEDLEEAKLRTEFVKMGSSSHVDNQSQLLRIRDTMEQQLQQDLDSEIPALDSNNTSGERQEESVVVVGGGGGGQNVGELSKLVAELTSQLEAKTLEFDELKLRSQFVKDHSSAHIERQSQLLDIHRQMSNNITNDNNNSSEKDQLIAQLKEQVEVLEDSLEEANLRTDFVKMGSASHAEKQRELVRIHSGMATKLSEQQEEGKGEEFERLSRENIELKEKLQQALEDVEDVKRKADFHRSHSGAHVERQAQLLDVHRQMTESNKMTQRIEELETDLEEANLQKEFVRIGSPGVAHNQQVLSQLQSLVEQSQQQQQQQDTNGAGQEQSTELRKRLGQFYESQLRAEHSRHLEEVQTRKTQLSELVSSVKQAVDLIQNGEVQNAMSVLETTAETGTKQLELCETDSDDSEIPTTTEMPQNELHHSKEVSTRLVRVNPPPLPPRSPVNGD